MIITRVMMTSLYLTKLKGVPSNWNAFWERPLTDEHCSCRRCSYNLIWLWRLECILSLNWLYLSEHSVELCSQRAHYRQIGITWNQRVGKTLSHCSLSRVALSNVWNNECWTWVWTWHWGQIEDSQPLDMIDDREYYCSNWSHSNQTLELTE